MSYVLRRVGQAVLVLALAYTAAYLLLAALPLLVRSPRGCAASSRRSPRARKGERAMNLLAGSLPGAGSKEKS